MRHIKVHLRAEVSRDVYPLDYGMFALRVGDGHRTLTPGEVGSTAVCGVFRAARLVTRRQLGDVTCEACRIQGAKNDRRAT